MTAGDATHRRTAGDGTAGGATNGTAGGAAGGAAGGSAGGAAGGRGALARRYRRLLLAYPRSYRRTHGTEIVTTLMDAAPPDRTSPSRREVRDLVAGGVRQRFRLPVGRSMVFVAVLFALVLGAFGSAVGSALGWATAPTAPDAAAFHRIAGTALNQPSPEGVQRDSQVFGLRPRVYAGRVVPDGWSVDAAREGLAAHGWRVGAVTSEQSPVYGDTGETVQATNRGFIARKGGLEIMVVISEIPGLPWHGTVMAQAAEPRPVLPLTLAGLVAGLVAGWLLAARAGYRLRRLPPLLQVPHVLAATMAVAGLGVSAPVALYALGDRLVGEHRFEGMPVFAGFHYDSPLDPLTLTALGALAVLIVLTWVPSRIARAATA